VRQERTDVTDPHLRASDADRERVVTALERHVAAGRLTLDEYAQRVSGVWAAVTHGELAAYTRDLPHEEAASGAQHRQLLWVFLLACGTLVLLAIVFGLAHH
jgi:hypothetical protein